ncbi:TetR/AcrR family transcriptional regulator [Corynebacterium sp. LK12]|uniref:TetR/AcrR family transcriptional regulator n=1 Tax=Corynebacterium sp. LK12 TaxID=2022658 RepID=UPI00164FA9FC|nr:TetR/AcrR family transcriptional regulator [Corynebacterium sp. LK12]
MRQDAVMNSDAIVEAARKLLIEQGAGVSMRAIAREAGVGVATASRHFPRRIELLDAVGARAAADIDRIVEAAVSQFDDDPDGAWHEAVHAIAELKAADLGQALFSDLTADTGDEAKEIDSIIEKRMAELRRNYTPLLEKAKAAGLCPDSVAPLDFHLGLSVVSRPLPNSAAVEQYFPGVQEKLVDLMLTGLAAQAKGNY